MRGESADIQGKAAMAAVACYLAAAACGAEALRTHLWLKSLGPICGFDRPGLFFLHCPACPAGLAFGVAAGLFAAFAMRSPAPVRVRVRR